MKVDPVCKMNVREDEACKAEVDGKIYYFCSEGCRQRFLEERNGPGGSRTDHELIVIGGGPAGLTAAVYTSILKVDTFVIAKNLGGQAEDSTQIENYMGFDFITGPELVLKFTNQLIHSHHVDHLIGEAEKLEVVDGRFSITASDLRVYTADAVILATGMTRRRLDVPGEAEFQRRGVFYGSVQDAAFVEGEAVAVVGGGNSAMQVVETLHPVTSEIHLVTRGRLSADPSVTERIAALDRVHIHDNHMVDSILGDGKVSGIVIREQGGSASTTIPVEGVFVAIGLAPNTSLVQGLVKLNKKGEIVIAPDCSTATPGLFAAGDVTDAYGKRIIIASGEGAKAALAVRHYLIRKRKARA
jgi:alkyl hydroperoxide reductase subunit F